MATDKITEATNAVDLRAKTAAIESIMKRAENLTRRMIKRELLAACNARLEQILVNDPIELESIEGDRKFAGQEDGSEARCCAGATRSR